MTTGIKKYSFPVFAKVPETLLGDGTVGVFRDGVGKTATTLPTTAVGTTAPTTILTASDSIIIWPTERAVQPTDYHSVTLWEAPSEALGSAGSPARILPITPLQNTVQLLGKKPQADQLDRVVSVPASNTVISHNRPLQASNNVWTDQAAIQPAASSFSQQRSATGQTTTRKKAARFALLGIMIISLVVMASVVIPDVYYRLRPESAAEVAAGLSNNRHETIVPVATPTPTPALPPIDASLPTGDWLRIPTIGVNAGVLTTTDPDEALRQGAWMVPDFGRPMDFTQPTIIASHRYGWLQWWKTDFGRKNSFYYLPDTVVGDRIEVVSDQRRFVYEIYAKEEGQTITDYDADLILYTCKFLNSPERYFVYAKRLPVEETPTANQPQSGETLGNAVIFDKT